MEGLGHVGGKRSGFKANTIVVCNFPLYMGVQLHQRLFWLVENSCKPES